MSKDLFAGRYELLNEMPAGAGGRLFEAHDTQTGERVAVKIFRHVPAPDSTERAKLERVFARLREAGHERVVRFHELWLEDGYCVREWVHGFSLLDLLRKRREVPGEEAIALLEGIGAALDFAGTQEFAPAGAFLSRLYVSFEPDVEREHLDRWRAQPLTKWPDFYVKLNPLSVNAFLPTREDDPMTTVAALRPSTARPLSPPVTFALMLYELLGGPHLSSTAPRYAPLSALNEAGNAVLRAAIEQRHVPASCAALWQELTAASALVPARPPAIRRSGTQRRLQLAGPTPPRLQAASVLELTPEDKAAVPIYLVARNSFRIGRAPQQADFVAKVLPETPENDKLTREIGRVHATAMLRNGRLFLADGNGVQPSTNGSTFDGVPLSSEPIPLDRPGLLALFRNYTLDILPLRHSRSDQWVIAGDEEWPGAPASVSPILGAVVFKAHPPHRAVRETAWLFTRVEFETTPHGIAWLEANRGTQTGAFLHHRGHFLLANLSLAEPPRVDDVVVAQNEAAPLATGQIVVLGAHRYSIAVS